MKDLPSLISITSDNSRLPHHEQVRVLIEKGGRFVQLRSKLLGHNELVDQVKLSSQYVLQSDTILIVNDFTKVAQSISVSGVHLGANDCNVVSNRLCMRHDITHPGTAFTTTTTAPQRLHDRKTFLTRRHAS